MTEITKKCPMCAEEIPLAATTCEYCDAQFEVTINGYCQNCHQIREADGNGQCKICGNSLMDSHAKSEYIKPDASIQDDDVPESQLAHVNKKSSVSCLLQIIGIILILGGVCFWIFRSTSLNLSSLFSTETPRPTHTLTPTPTSTATPTRTPLPTSTPLPMEVTFDTIGNYPTGQSVILAGQLVMFGSTHCDSECGMLLKNPLKSSQTITIFVKLGESRQNTLPNQMRPLPDPYSKSDIQVRLDDATYAGIGSRIIVTGRICETTEGTPCISSIIKIENWK